MLLLLCSGNSCHTFSDPCIKDKACNDLDDRCRWYSQPDIKQPAGCAAHPPGNGNANQERCCNALEHDEPCFSEPVEKADEAEQEARQQAVDAISSEIVKACGHYFRIPGEEPTEKVAMEEGDLKHNKSKRG